MADSAIEINVDEMALMWADEAPEPDVDKSLDYINNMESEEVSPEFQEYDQVSPENYLETSGELSRSEMVLPTSPQLDATVLVISLATEKGIDVERWLLVADTDESGNSPRRSGGSDKDEDEEDATLIPSEDFQSRMLSLSMVVSTHEMDTTREEIELGVSPEALSMIDDFFGVSQVDIAVENSDGEKEEEDEEENMAMFVDVSYFLVHCFENMDRVKTAHQERITQESERLQLQAKEAAGRARLLLLQAHDSPRRYSKPKALSPYRSPHSSPARTPPRSSPTRSPKRAQTEAQTSDMDAYIKELLDERAAARESAQAQQARQASERADVVTLTPTSVVSRRSNIERSPFDEEIAFELDEEEDEITLGSDGLPVRKGKKANTGKKSNASKKSKAERKADADLLHDLVNNLVRHSDAYLRVRRRLAFVRSRDPTIASNYVGPPRTSVLPKGFGDGKKKRLSIAEVQKGMLAGHLILSNAQVHQLFRSVAFFAQHMRTLYQQQEELRAFEEAEKQTQNFPRVNVLTGEMEFSSSGSSTNGTARKGKGTGSPSRSASKSLLTSYYGMPEEAGNDLPPVPPSPRSRAKFQGPLMDDIVSPKKGSTSPERGRPSRDRELSPPPPAVNLRCVPAGNGNGKSVTRVSASRDATFRSSVNSLLSATLSTALTQSAAFGGTEALTTVSIRVRCGDNVWSINIPSSNMRTVYKKKISSEWLDYYLQYLHRAHKSTVLHEISLSLQQPEEAKRFALNQQVERFTGVSHSPESQDGNYELSGAGASPEAVTGLQYDDSRPDKVVLPAALVKALNGQIHLCKVSDRHLDVLVTRNAKSLMSKATLIRELNIRLHRWVGNVDAAGNYDKCFRISMRSATNTELKRIGGASSSQAGGSPSVSNANPTTPSISAAKPATPATADSAGSGLLNTVTKKQLASRVKRLLLSTKREELIASERMDATITRELFWKYACYCRDNHRSVADQAVCGWDEWLIWRFENFSNTHKDVLAYKQAAIDRLQEKKKKEQQIEGMEAAVDGMILASLGNTGFSAATANTIRGNSGNSTSTDVAFGRGSNISAANKAAPVVITIPQTQTLSSKPPPSAPVDTGAAPRRRAKHEAEIVYKKWCAAKDAERALNAAMQLEQDMDAVSKQRRKRLQAKRAFTEWENARKQQIYFVRDKATGQLRTKKLEKFQDLEAKHPVDWNPHLAKIEGGAKRTGAGEKGAKASAGAGKKGEKKKKGRRPVGLAAAATQSATKTRKTKTSGGRGGNASAAAAAAAAGVQRRHWVREDEDEEMGIELTETHARPQVISKEEENGIELIHLNRISRTFDIVGDTINL